MKVNSNIQGMIAQSILQSNEAKMAKSTEKMSSGYKLNRAMDNPSGMAISNRMRARLSSLDRANKNAKNAINAVQTAEGAVSEIEAMLQRMNELSVQASNGTLTENDRNAIQAEMDQLSREISRISKATTYNTQNLLDGSQALKGYSDNPETLTVRDYNEKFPLGDFEVTIDADGKGTLKDKDGNNIPVESKAVPFTDKDTDAIIGYRTTLTTKEGGEIIIDTKGSTGGTANLDIDGIGGMKIQVGAEKGQEIQVVIPEVSLRSLGLEGPDGKPSFDCTTEKGAQKTISVIESAIDYVSAVRSKIGAYQNRIESTVSNLDVTSENLTESYSTIKDIDMAEGMVEYTTLQVLVQAGTTMLAQANEQPQQALQLLQ